MPGSPFHKTPIPEAVTEAAKAEKREIQWAAEKVRRDAAKAAAAKAAAEAELAEAAATPVSEAPTA